MSVSAHIAAQRTDHGVPHAVSCRALGVAASTFYKWHNRPPTPAKRRRAELDVEVRACFHQQHDQPNRLRTSQRSLNQPSTIRGEAHLPGDAAEYWFALRARNASGVSVWSHSIGVEVPLNPTASRQVPCMIIVIF